MTMNDVVWRQACTIKAKSDELVAEVQKDTSHIVATYDIEQKATMVVCYAACATGDISPMYVYDDILTQVGQLQSSVWGFCKTCVNSTIQSIAKKLYEACATLKKRLKKRLLALSENVAPTNPQTSFSRIDAPETTLVSTAVASWT